MNWNSTVVANFCLAIARQFSFSMKKSQKLTVYVKPYIKCYILVLEDNLLISDL
jgi:hypothetical protein